MKRRDFIKTATISLSLATSANALSEEKAENNVLNFNVKNNNGEKKMKKKEVVVVIGAGAIAQAIARRVGTGRHIILSGRRIANLENVADTLRRAGFDCSVAQVDASDRNMVKKLAQLAAETGEVKYLIHTAGLSPSQDSAEAILKVDLYGTAVVLEEFGKIITENGSGITIGSQSAFRLPVDEFTQEQADLLATLPPEELLNLPFVKSITDPLKAYQVSKRANAFRVIYEAVNWAKRGARVNQVSAGIIFTPLAYDELNSPERGAFYRNMLEKSPAGRGGTPDELGDFCAFVMNATYISGSDLLIDGGVTASYKYGLLKPQ